MSAVEALEAKRLLLQSSDEYRELADVHHRLDTRLHELGDKPHLSDDEQLEEQTIKKRKLVLKDQMEDLARAYVRSRAALA